MDERNVDDRDIAPLAEGDEAGLASRSSDEGSLVSENGLVGCLLDLFGGALVTCEELDGKGSG